VSSAAPLRVVAGLGATQTLAWASTYYLPAMLATPIADELSMPASTVFAAFSASLIMSAAVGPRAGRAIDHWGGRPVLAVTSLVFAIGLGALGSCRGLASLFGAWLLIGVGMGAGLYEAAFSTLVRLYGRDARGAITGITLMAGFASTVGWPLSSFMVTHIGWRGACFAWAAVHLLAGLPMNALLPSARKASPVSVAAPDAAEARERQAPRLRATLALSFVFAATWFISTAMAAHLPRLLQAAGVGLAGSVLVGSLIGPAQVGARILEFGFLRRIHPLLSARIAAALHPAGALLLFVAGAPAAVVFGLLHGAGNGILTIAKGTLPLVLFGTHGYGRRQGLLTVPARVAQALAPWVFGLCLDRWSVGALWVSGAIGILALGALFAIPKVGLGPEG
jgi:predicted MFS family arabinose efflux permease